MSRLESQSPPHTQLQFNGGGMGSSVFTTTPTPASCLENHHKATDSSSSTPSSPAQRRRRARTVVLVRDPPGERLAGLTDRLELYDYSDSYIPLPLESVRGAGKPDVEIYDNSPSRIGSEFPLSYDDILQDYHDNSDQSFDIAGPSAPPPLPSNTNQQPTPTPAVQATPNERPEADMVRRRSFQALVPSFLQGSSNNGPFASPPKTPSPPTSLPTSPRPAFDASTRPAASSVSTPPSPTLTRFSGAFASKSTSKNVKKARARAYTTSSPPASFFSITERELDAVDYFTLPIRPSPPALEHTRSVSSQVHPSTTIPSSLDTSSPGPSTTTPEDPVDPKQSRASPPPSFLLDDDPFANLSGPPVDSRAGCSGASTSTMGELSAEAPMLPRSPLHPELPSASSATTSSSSTSTNLTPTPIPTPTQPPNSPPPLSRASSAGTGRVPQGRPAQPAHQRPAFKSRPSLPSLDTLARMNVVLGGRKPRKGKPGAGLPFEPWDTMGDAPPPLPTPPMPTMVPTTLMADAHPSLVAGSSSLASTSTSTLASTLTVVPAASQLLSTTTSVVTTNSMPDTSTLSSTLPSTPNTTLAMQIVLDPNNVLPSGPLPLGQRPLLPSEIMSLGGLSSVGVVYAPAGTTAGGDGGVNAAATLSIPIEGEPTSRSLSLAGGDEDDDLVTPTAATPASAFNGPAAEDQASPDPPAALFGGFATRTSVDQELLAHMDGLESLLFSQDENDIDHLLQGYQREPPPADQYDDHHSDISSSIPPPHQRHPSSSSNSIEDLDVEDPSSSRLSSESRSYSDLNYDYGYQHESDSSHYNDNYGYGYQYPDSHPYTPSLSRSSHPSSTSLSLSASLSRSLSNVSYSSREEGGGDLQEEKEEGFGRSTPPKLLRTQSSSDESAGLQSPSVDDPLFEPLLSSTSSLFSKVVLSDNFTRVRPQVQSPPRATLVQADAELRVLPESQLGVASSSARERSDVFEGGGRLDVGLEAHSGDIESRPGDVGLGAEVVDGAGHDSGDKGGSRYHTYASTSAPSHTSGTTSSSNGYGYHSSSSGAYRGQGQRDDEEEDGRRRPRGRGDEHSVEVVSRAASSSEATSSEDESTDGYDLASSSQRTLTGPVSMRQLHDQATARFPMSPKPTLVSMSTSSGAHSRSVSNFTSTSASTSASVSVSASPSDDEDDIPLAQRIPSALTAQKSIQRKVREEKERRKKEKSEALRTRQMTLRPAGAGGPDPAGEMISSSHDAALAAVSPTSSSHSPQPPLQQRRQRTQTLPGKAAQPFSPEDLAKKLQNVQIAELIPPLPVQPHNFAQQLIPGRSRAKSMSRGSHEAYHGVEGAPSTNASAPLRARSVRHPAPPPFGSPPALADPPLSSTLRPMRSFRRPSERSAETNVIPPLPFGAEPRVSRHPTLARRASRDHRRSPSQPNSHSLEPRVAPDEPLPPLPVAARISTDEHRKMLTRAPSDAERPPRPNLQQQLLGNPKSLVAQQRIFIGDMQRFNMVEIGPATTAQDALDLIEAEGSLKGWAGSGGWMVFEVAQDFGMERPIRSFELLADVQSSWNKDKMVNYFVLRLTPLFAPLDRSAIPPSSPTHSGYVEWESKRGKWSKRWMQLREHSIWISKRDNRRDEVLLCSLSNFDAYHITRSHRAPKPFAFALKSTDNLSFFEDTADYLHSFACNEKDGRVWLEKILVARSYVLHQERHVLFSPKSTSGGTSATLSRSNTKKSLSTTQRPLQPLVALAPGYSSSAQLLPHQDVFEPGSLLSKQL